MATRVNQKKATTKTTPKKKAAAKKPAAKKAAPSAAKPAAAKKKAAAAPKKPAAKKTTSRKKAAAFGLVAPPADLVEVLTALPVTYDEPIDVSVPLILGEAAELLGIGDDVGEHIIAHSRLTDDAFSELLLREQRLDHAQRGWLSSRRRSASVELSNARTTAEAIKDRLKSKLRHFVTDKDGQRRLDELEPGDSDNDTIHDLKGLADIYDDFESMLAKAHLPVDIATQAREAAEALKRETSSVTETNASLDAKAMRNKAYWHLRKQMDEIRDAGRHVYEDDAPRRKWFFATSTRHVKRAAVGRPRKAKGVPEAEAVKAPESKDEPKK